MPRAYSAAMSREERRASTHAAIDPSTRTSATVGTTMIRLPRKAAGTSASVHTVRTLSSRCHCDGGDRSGLIASPCDLPAVATTSHSGIPISAATRTSAANG
ncbi:hypothetical protein ACFQFC_37075 [Amorphoplanes digitatis]|uniref:hypothetical protein n=1 Tax=Actinoplanes digitatis TaxID=1868 RepID=UPI0036082CCB